MPADFRKLMFCPECGGQTPAMKKSGVKNRIVHMTHSFENWEAYRKSCREMESRTSGARARPIALKVRTMRVVCPACGYGAYYLASTGRQCDVAGNTDVKFLQVPARPFDEKRG